MIYKGKNYGNSINVTIIESGNGDLELAPGKGVNSVCLAISNCPQTNVGYRFNHKRKGKPIENVDVLLTFDNPDSIDIWIEFLKKSKKTLIKMQNQTP